MILHELIQEKEVEMERHRYVCVHLSKRRQVMLVWDMSWVELSTSSIVELHKKDGRGRKDAEKTSGKSKGIMIHLIG